MKNATATAALATTGDSDPFLVTVCALTAGAPAGAAVALMWVI